jgi:antibiotic biosynthesis monooxygenase (ABM) superfamily enzyme
MSPFENLASARARVLWLEQQRAEIERAISNVKGEGLDKWFCRQWYRAAAMRKWQHRQASDRGRWFE